NAFPVSRVAAGNLLHSGGTATSYFEEFGTKSFARDDRLDRFGDFVDLEPEAIGHHRYRFRQSVMLDDASCSLLFEVLRTQPCAHLPLQWQAPFRGIHSARYPYGIHSLRSSAQSQHEFIHHE